MKSFFYRRVIGPIKRLLQQGITPRKIALTLALAVVLGVFPIMGSTSLLCAAAAVVFGLNMPTIQAVNYVMYPVQLLMIVPFIRMGETLFRANQTSLTLKQMIALTTHGFGPAVHALWIFAVQGIAAWLLIAPVATAILFYIFLAIVQRIKPRRMAEVRA